MKQALIVLVALIVATGGILVLPGFLPMLAVGLFVSWLCNLLGRWLSV